MVVKNYGVEYKTVWVDITNLIYKDMKKLSFLGLLLSVFTMWSCNSYEEVEVKEQPSEFMVSIGFKGDISVTDVPLSRASGDDLYGIMVYSCLDSIGKTDYSEYAYGLFDDLTAMNVKLLAGYKYKFVATMVKDGKNKLWENKGVYASPFVMSITNEFKYDDASFLTIPVLIFKYGYCALKDGKSYSYPAIDRYYGEYENYKPIENGSVSINMLRTVFGVKVVTENLTEGTLDIKIKDTPGLQIKYPSTEAESIYSLYELYKTVTNKEYSETIGTVISWTRKDGVVVPMGTHNITYKRNRQTIITINVEDASQENALSLSLEDEEMGQGNTYTVTGDQITDTTVKPEIEGR